MGMAPEGMQIENDRNAVCTGEGGSFQFHAVMVLGADD